MRFSVFVCYGPEILRASAELDKSAARSGILRRIELAKRQKRALVIWAEDDTGREYFAHATDCNGADIVSDFRPRELAEIRGSFARDDSEISARASADELNARTVREV